MPSILITNTVPLNGGDEALLRATVQSLGARIPQAAITVLCSDPRLVQDWIQDIDLRPDLEHARTGTRMPLDGARVGMARWLRKRRGNDAVSAWADRTLELPGRRETIELYRSSDVVVSGAGGFFHDFYPIEDRLRGLEVALDLGKPVVLFAQSIGPFWKRESISRVRSVFNRVSKICVRDELSRDYLISAGVEQNRIISVADVAFLWRTLEPSLYVEKSGAPRKIGMCFREWPLGDTQGLARTIDRAVDLCHGLLLDDSKELVFISTCQGIEGYVDDSAVALEIVSRLTPTERQRCRVDRLRRPPRELIAELSRCDAFIGMRLHACILSMLGGRPAMGIGYESKTEQIFGQLGLSSYQVPFDSEASEWLRCSERFLSDQVAIKDLLPQALDRAAARAEGAVDAVVQCLEEKEGHGTVSS